MLVGWDEIQKQQLRTSISATKPPLFAVSAHFSGDPAMSVYLTWATLLGRAPQILHYHSILSSPSTTPQRWEAILDHFNTLLTTELRLAALPMLDDNEPLKVIHVTDLHFNNESIAEDVEQIATCLAGKSSTQGNFRADFLAITGDVVDKAGGDVGAITAGVGARDWVKRTFSNGWFRDKVSRNFPNPRVLLVPGNHDFRQTLAAGAYLERDKNSPSGFALLAITPRPTTSDWTFGLGPFLHQHEELTGSRFPHGAVPPFRVEGRFAALGIIFIELWLQQYVIGGYGSPINTDYIGKGLSEALNRINLVSQPDDCVVVLLHALNIQDRLPDSIDDRIFKTIGQIRSDRRVIVLKGHYHQSLPCKHPNNPSVLIVDGGNAGGGKERVVSPITLARQGGLVTACTVDRITRTQANGWRLEPDRAICGGVHAEWTPSGWRI